MVCFVSRGFYSICCWAGVYGRDSFEMGLLSFFFFFPFEARVQMGCTFNSLAATWEEFVISFLK